MKPKQQSVELKWDFDYVYLCNKKATHEALKEICDKLKIKYQE